MGSRLDHKIDFSNVVSQVYNCFHFLWYNLPNSKVWGGSGVSEGRTRLVKEFIHLTCLPVKIDLDIQAGDADVDYYLAAEKSMGWEYGERFWVPN